MSDLLEDDLREALVDRAARITPERVPGCGRLTTTPLPAAGVAPAVAAEALGAERRRSCRGRGLLLGSSASARVRRVDRDPTAPLPGQLSRALTALRRGSGSPVLTDTRGPYTASIYADGSTCLHRQRHRDQLREQGATRNPHPRRNGRPSSMVPGV